ncbi:MAG: LLM class flavin-dependent oxidoreductase [Candidatus Nitrosopolaris sp.]
MRKQHELEFGLTIPQGWRGGDLPLEEENDPVKQYEFSKSISVAADRIGFDSIYAYDHFIPFYSEDRDKNIFECFTLLSALAAITERIKIGQIVHADRYNLFFGTLNEMETKISLLKEHCKSIGRDDKELQYSIVLPCIIKGTDQEVNQVLVQYKRKDKTSEEYLQYLVGGVAVGTPEKVLQGIKKYIDIEVTHFILHFIGLYETTLRLFDAKVIRSA